VPDVANLEDKECKPGGFSRDLARENL